MEKLQVIGIREKKKVGSKGWMRRGQVEVAKVLEIQKGRAVKIKLIGKRDQRG
jgi:hypothetical protein